MGMSLAPYVIVSKGHEALEWYKRAFGATVDQVSDGPNGKLMHAMVKIGDSMFFVCDDMPEMGSGMGMSPERAGGTTFSFYHMVDNADASYDKAIKAGAKSAMKPQDAFWGHRWSMVVDPFGHMWQIAHLQKQMTHEEMMEGMKSAAPMS